MPGFGSFHGRGGTGRGTADAIAPFGGLRLEGPNGPITVLASMEQTFVYWAYRLRCSDGMRPTVLPSILSPAITVHVPDTLDCRPLDELRLVVIVGGGHDWTGRPSRLPVQISGDVKVDVDESRCVWEFFERHRLS